MTRQEMILSFFPSEPAHRTKQIEQALFDPAISNWLEVTTLPKAMREKLDVEVCWQSVKQVKMLESENQDTFKALLELHDGFKIESVLMANRRGSWTACVSSQVGCGMRCAFCATGQMGFKRSLNHDEIIDQYRFWQNFLLDKFGKDQARVSNIVFMGMGEPLANYDNVKIAINRILDSTDLGVTNITVSTVGLLPILDKILTDTDWPNVRIAISLHSANEEKRRHLMPSTTPDFIEKLSDWTHHYSETLGNRRHRLTFEYILLDDINDASEDAQELAHFVKKCGAKIKINVIPFNCVPSNTISASQKEKVEAFKSHLLRAGIDVTERKAMGTDIAAACGQLAGEK